MVKSEKGGVIVLTEGRPWKCILRFALPLFFGSLLQQMYYTVDAMMVGRLAGEQALSGVGTCAVLTNLLIAFSVGFSAGSSIVSAQYFGAGQYQGIAKNALASMVSLAALGLGIGGLSVGFGRQMLRFFVSVPESLLVNSFGEAMIASYTVVSRVEGYMHLPTQTLYQAIPTYTAQNIGAGKRERIRIGLKDTVMLAVGSTFFISAAAFFFAEPLAAVFGIEGLSASYCAENVKWLSFPILLFALYFPCTGLYQGVGKGMVSTALSSTFLSICLLFAYTLQHIPAIGYRSLFICKPMAWVIVASINYIYYFKGRWETASAIDIASQL